MSSKKSIQVDETTVCHGFLEFFPPKINDNTAGKHGWVNLLRKKPVREI